MADRLRPQQELADEQPSVINENAAALPQIDDYYKWGYEQAAFIPAGRFDMVDILDVADEIEDVARRERKAVVGNVEVVLLHMLKWEFQPARRSMSWVHLIEEHRDRLRDDMDENASLKTDLAPIIQRAHRHARRGAARETKLAMKTFPIDCPFSWSEIMQTPYQPIGD